MSPTENGNVCIEPIVANDIAKRSDERTNTFRYLLNANHEDNAILYNSLRFHNHSPHFLGSAYLYGGSEEYIQNIYDDILRRGNLEPWEPSPGKITSEDYRDYLGKGEYQRAWVDFFEEQFQSKNGEDGWQSIATKLLLDTGHDNGLNSIPMLNCLNTGLGHPLIHLGYAFELNSMEVAAEALGLTAGCYDKQFASLLNPPPASNPASSELTSDLFEIFQRIYNDETLPTFSQPGDENVEVMLEKKDYLKTILTYFNSWNITNPMIQFSQAHRLASLLLISSASQVGGHGYDFFLVHVLTTAHAVRVLLPNLPAEHYRTVLREWFLIALLVYVAQNRPRLDPAHVTSFELQGRDWEWVRKQANEGKYSIDAHFAKACRAMNVAAETWKDDTEQWFLKSAVRFASEFEGWCGFNTEGEDAAQTRMHRLRDGIHVK